MIEDRQQVIAELKRLIIRGADPFYGWESALDHGVNFMDVLTEAEFNQTCILARLEKVRTPHGQTQAGASGNQPAHGGLV